MNFIRFCLASLTIVTTQTMAMPRNAQTIDELARTFMVNSRVNSMSIAVINDKNIQFFNYGYSNEISKIPTSNNTIYTIASFTKTFTAAVTAVAAVENKLKLDEAFNQYFPELSRHQALHTITPRMLLGHVATLPFDFLPRPQTRDEIIAAYLNYIPQTRPGTEYSYSNASIGTMGYVLENIYGKSYQEILVEKVLNPLHMRATYLNVPKERERYIAIGHDKDNNIMRYNTNNEAWFAAASLKSTIADMARYLRAQIHYVSKKNKHLTAALAMVHQNTYCFTDKISCEQLAWQAHDISVLNNSIGDSYFKDYDSNGLPTFDQKQIVNYDTLTNHTTFIDKTGSGYGMSSYMAYIPSKKTGVVILINKSVGDARIRLGRDILLNQA
jgi:beta-lactamase class C